ncbi:MAG: peptide deformylase, partial [Myxococcales bacterium]|nr:peptide deformylase [Myxococcales bacterium]
QHELDHLNGITFVDRLNEVQKKLVVREYLRQRAEDEEDDTVEAIRSVHGK